MSEYHIKLMHTVTLDRDTVDSLAHRIKSLKNVVMISFLNKFIHVLHTSNIFFYNRFKSASGEIAKPV